MKPEIHELGHLPKTLPGMVNVVQPFALPSGKHVVVVFTWVFGKPDFEGFVSFLIERYQAGLLVFRRSSDDRKPASLEVHIAAPQMEYFRFAQACVRGHENDGLQMIGELFGSQRQEPHPPGPAVLDIAFSLLSVIRFPQQQSGTESGFFILVQESDTPSFVALKWFQLRERVVVYDFPLFRLAQDGMYSLELSVDGDGLQSCGLATSTPILGEFLVDGRHQLAKPHRKILADASELKLRGGKVGFRPRLVLLVQEFAQGVFAGASRFCADFFTALVEVDAFGDVSCSNEGEAAGFSDGEPWIGSDLVAFLGRSVDAIAIDPGLCSSATYAKLKAAEHGVMDGDVAVARKYVGDELLGELR